VTVHTESWNYDDTSFRVPTAADGERTATHVHIAGETNAFNGARIRGGCLRYGADAPSAGDVVDTNNSVSQWNPRQRWANIWDAGCGSAEMYARVKLDSFHASLSELYLVARASLTDGVIGGYGLQFRPGVTPELRLFRMDTLAVIGTSYSGVVAGDTLEIRCNGTSVKGFVNGVERVSATDSTFTTGDQVAIRVRTSTVNTWVMFDDLKWGHLSAGAPVESPVEPAVPAVTHGWLGGVTATGAQVKVGVRNVTDCRIVVKQGASTVVTTGYVTPNAAGVCVFNITGLSARTAYTWQVQYRSPGGDDTWAQFGQIRTTPTPGAPASFRFGFASCAGSRALDASGHTLSAANTRNPWTYDRMLERGVNVFAHMGDLFYRDLTTTNIGPWRRAMRDSVIPSRSSRFFRTVPIIYTADDHDYSYDFNTHVARAQWRQVVDEFVPAGGLLAAPADGQEPFGQMFVWGRVRVIMLDARSERYQSPTRTILGSVQLQALKDALLAATEPLIVVGVGTPWNGNSDDAWGGSTNGAAAERAELGKFIFDNDLTDRVVLIHGDAHMLAYDDGTNTKFGAGVTVGPRLCAAAPIESSSSFKGGPYTGGTFPTQTETANNEYPTVMQYGVLEVVDSGDELDVTFRGLRVDYDGETETELLTANWTIETAGDPITPDPFDPPYSFDEIPDPDEPPPEPGYFVGTHYSNSVDDDGRSVWRLVGVN
jgi:hypothetical protein